MRNSHFLCPTHEHLLNRRTLMQWAAGLAGAGVLSSTAQAKPTPKENPKQILFIWLDGGISQLESWDPKPGTPFGGPFRAIPTSVPGIHISELLPHTAKQMHHLSLVRSLHTQDNSHSAGVDRIQRGDPKNRGVTYPFLGSAVAKLLGPTSSGLPPYISIKPGGGGFITKDAGFLGPDFSALALGDGKPPENLLPPPTISPTLDEQRDELRGFFDAEYAKDRQSKTADSLKKIHEIAQQLRKHRDLFDENSYSAKDKERYGTHELGRHLLIARRMIEAGVRFTKVTSYGWDTHGDNFHGSASLVPQFDQPFAALLEDLHERKLLDQVLVIAMSEFGRTPRINGHLGRDHWPEAWSLAMGGAGIQAGAVYGRTNDKGTDVAEGEVDIGHLFHTWFRAMNVDPFFVEYDNNGQPLPIAHDNCKPITVLLRK